MSIPEALSENQKHRQLKSDDERHRLIIDSLTDGIWDWDVDNDTLYLSPQWKAQLGYSDDEIANSFDSWVALLHPKDAVWLMQALESFLQNPGAVWNQEFRLLHKNGEYVWINAMGSCIQDDEGKVVRILGVHIDIHQRKQAEASAHRKQLLLDAVVRGLPDIIFVLSPDGTICDYHSSDADALYLPPETFLGKRMQDLLPPTVSARFLKSLRKSIKQNQLVSMEYSLEVNHAIRQFEARINALADEEQVIAVVRDVTQTKQTQQRFQSLVENSHEWFWEIDQNLGYSYVSPRCNELFGYTVEEIIGSSIFDLIVPEQKQALREQFDRAINNSERFDLLENTYLHKQGRQVVMETSGTPILNELGSVLGYRGVSRDVTRRKKTESQLKERLKEMGCLFYVLKDMQEQREQGELCKRMLVHLANAMQYPEIAVPVIDIVDQRYAHSAYTQALSNRLKSSVSVAGTLTGHISVYYSSHRDCFLAEEQNLIDTVAELLGNWLERQRISKELQQSEDKFRLINRLIPGAIYINDASSLKNEYISESGLAILGLDARALSRALDNWKSIILTGDQPGFSSTLQTVLKSQDSNYELEYRITHAVTGEIKWISDHAFIERDCGGNATRLFGLMQDITARKDREQRLSMHERLVSTTDELMSFIDTSYTYRMVNDAYEKNFGIPKNEIIGSKVEKLLGREVFEKMSKPHLDRCFNGEDVQFQAWYPIGAQLKYLSLSYQPYRDEKGEVVGAVVSSRDITSQINDQQKIRQSAEVFKSTIEGVIIADLDANILDVNKAFTEITGYTRDDVIGKNPRLLQSGLHDEEFYEQLWKQLIETGRWRGEIWNRRKDGSIFPELVNISTVTDGKDLATGYVSVFSDITSNKETEKRLDFLAHHDPLTQLPNRLLFNSRLNQSIKHAKRSKGRLAVLFVDLDRFKNINDTLGHAAGDSLLKQVAKRILGSVREDDTVARISGDEFVILLERTGSADECSNVVHKIMQTFEKPFALDDQDVRMNCSIGISVFPDDGVESDILITNADAAMYRAKEESHSSYQFYTQEMTTGALEHIFIENALRAALEKEEFELVYQPQIDLTSERIVGLEALIRWNHPQQGRISPATFIPVAEQNGMIRDIGEWVLKTSCQQARVWLDRGLEFGRVAVNVSGAQITPHFAELVTSVLSDTGLEEKYLELEVTESFVMKHLDEGIQQLMRLNEQGISVSVDDFGTGYSSLSYLKSLPVNKLKIDQSFVVNIPEDEDDIAISEAIIALGRALKLQVIAEGVETRQQAEILLTKGCHEAQGYFYSRPLAVHMVEKKIREMNGL